MNDTWLASVPSPAYVVDEGLLIQNLETLRRVMDNTGCKILLAQKAFSMFYFYPLIGRYLSGTTASGLYEARLGHEAMPEGEVHVFNPAYTAADMEALVGFADHLVFNSMHQWRTHRATVEGCGRAISCGLRVNPHYSEIDHAIYNPCAPGSRLGIPREALTEADLDGISGLHFHTMCEQGADVLARTLPHVEEQFGAWLPRMRWLNFGGGHHITRPGYDIALLEQCIRHVQETYGVQVYLEPGEAVALNTGWLVATVLDVNQYGADTPVAILDASAACHMPDVLEMPYRPVITGAGLPGEKPYTYRLGGPTCLAGDVIGDYAFDAPLTIGQRLIFGDMAHYSMVKNNTFNGMPLPSIVVRSTSGVTQTIRTFSYDDFKSRLS